MASDHYDPSVQALLTPGAKDIAPLAYDWANPLAQHVECCRLAYLHADLLDSERQRLVRALDPLGYRLLDVSKSAATGTYAFCALHQGQNTVVIAFRGTEPTDVRDVGTDLLALPTSWGDGGAMVHAGFALAYGSARDDVARWVTTLSAGTRLTLVGHSLGAALATLAGTQYPQAHVTTIGGPRIGNHAFVESIPHRQLTRIVGCADLVPALPPEGLFGYSHPAACIYIDSVGQLHADPDPDFMATDQQAGRATYHTRYPLRPDHVPLRDLADHSPVNYLNAFRRLA